MSHHIDDYLRAFSIKGVAQFKRDYCSDVLMGLRLVGDLSEDGERGEAQTFLAALHDDGEVTRSLNRRIWPIVKSPYGPASPRVSVGRSSDNDVVIPEYSISQMHCAFSMRPDGLLQVVDLESHNGTLVNDQRLKPGVYHVIEDQDEIVLGRYLFEYLCASSFLQRVEVMARAPAHLRPKRGA